MPPEPSLTPDSGLAADLRRPEDRPLEPSLSQAAASTLKGPPPALEPASLCSVPYRGPGFVGFDSRRKCDSYNSLSSKESPKYGGS